MSPTPRRRGQPFSFGYPRGHQPTSVAAIPFSQLRPEHEESATEVDRRWNGQPMRDIGDRWDGVTILGPWRRS